MTVERRDITIQGARQQLFATVEAPDPAIATGPRRGIVFFHAVGSYRVGPHDILVTLTREALARGFVVLRFDFAGHGDSLRLTDRIRHDRPFPSMLADMVDDVRVVKAEFTALYRLDQIVGVGICSGAMAGLRSFLESPAPAENAIALLAIPPLNLFSVRYFFSRMRWTLLTYVKKGFQGSTWRRLLKGDLDFRSIARAFGIGRKRPPASDATNGRERPATVGAADAAPKTTPAAPVADSETEGSDAAPEGFRMPVSWLPKETRQRVANRVDQRVLLLVPDGDVARHTVISSYRRLFDSLGMELTVDTVAAADHSFSSIRATEEVIERLGPWLDRLPLPSSGPARHAAAGAAASSPFATTTIPVDGGELWATFASGRGSEAPRLAVLVAPFFAERNTAYSSLVMLAADLVAQGWDVVTYDQRGFGESDPLAAATWSDHRADLAAVIAWGCARANTAAATLIGLRLGATLAALEADRNAAVEGLVALEPVVHGRAYVRQLLAATGLSLKGAHVVDDGAAYDLNGLRVPRSLLDQISLVDLAQSAPTTSVHRAIWSLHRTASARQDLESLRDHWAAARCAVDLHELPTVPFWSRVGELASAAVIRQVATVTSRKHTTAGPA